MLATLPLLVVSDFPAIRRGRVETLQVNLGYRCNQSCAHCHVNAGPARRETMALETIEEVLHFLRVSRVPNLDITGGSPELNAHFRHLVRSARELGVKVMDRCNLTILSEPGQEDLAEFLACLQVEIIASLPCYLEENVDRQRGQGVFAGSIAGLRTLNALGYGDPASGLELSLVYNPQGPSLPPGQVELEAAYREHLADRYGIVFTRLYTIANMPIQRFGSTLVSTGQFHEYIRLLRANHSAANLESVMCRTLLSVDWEGFVYDCDFNQMLGLPLVVGGQPRLHISDLAGRRLEGNAIAVADHCYGCTAGQGSSCGGALAV